MATKSFLFWQVCRVLDPTWRFVSLGTLCVFVASVLGCQTGPFSRSSAKQTVEVGETLPDGTEVVEGPNPDGEIPSIAQPKEDSFVQKKAPALGVILGGGGVLTFAQVGVLQELSRQKIPVKAIVGLEWGALVAGAYSLNGKVHEVEWQLLKMPHKNFNQSSVFGKKSPATIQKFEGYLNSLFQKRTFSSAAIPFSCPYLDVKRKKTTMAKRGKMADALKFCWPSLPEFALSPRMANPSGYGKAVQFLKEQGAELILIVDVLDKNELFNTSKNSPNLAAQLYWLQMQGALGGLNQSDIHEVFSIPVSGVGYSDFASMRSAIRVGQLKSRKMVEEFAKKYGF